jgi:hypothetical protein
MISEKHIERINKVIKDMVFDYDGKIFTPDLNIDFQYQFIITGQRRMISVGEYYDHLDVLVEIIDGNERTTKFFVVFKTLNDNLNKDYMLTNYLGNSISDELSYFFGEDYVRVRLVKIQFSEEYNQKINDMSLKILKK